MITYKLDAKLTGEQLADIFRRSGIRRPVDDLPRMQLMVDRADVLVTAWEVHRLVGVSRAITDFCFCCYLSDLAVDREYQHKGIGKEMVRLTRDAIGPQSMLLLLSAPEAMEYYPKIGFARMDRAWIMDRIIG